MVPSFHTKPSLGPIIFGGGRRVAAGVGVSVGASSVGVGEGVSIGTRVGVWVAVFVGIGVAVSGIIRTTVGGVGIDVGSSATADGNSEVKRPLSEKATIKTIISKIARAIQIRALDRSSDTGAHVPSPDLILAVLTA